MRPSLSRASVDRDGLTRDDPAALERAWASARVLVVDDGAALVSEDDRPRLVLLDAAEAPAGERFYLGRDADGPVFAVAAPVARSFGARRLGLREVGALLDDRDAGILTHAVGLTNWHATHRRCARCGAPTEPARGGSVRRCIEDGSEHFPRTDPAVIMLVTSGEPGATASARASRRSNPAQLRRSFALATSCCQRIWQRATRSFGSSGVAVRPCSRAAAASAGRPAIWIRARASQGCEPAPAIAVARR